MIFKPHAGANMKRHSWNLLVFCCWVTLGLGEAPAQKGFDEAIQWYDSLGYPDIDDKPFVKVATAPWHPAGLEPPHNTYLHGFLIDQLDADFSVFTLSSATRKFTSTAPDVRENRRVGYEKVDLNDFARTLADNALVRQGNRSPEIASKMVESFTLARLCKARGLYDLARRLWKQSTQAPRVSGGGGTKLQRLQLEFAHVQMWCALNAFADPKVSRKDLLDRFRHIFKHYANSPHHKRAKYTLLMLTRMVREDEQHAKAKRDFDTLPKEQQISDLIFRLRDQCALPDPLFKTDNVFADRRGDKSPAHRLRAIGLEAVPQLLVALEDDRFTRSVANRTEPAISHRILRVGDAAQQILSEIAGRRFRPMFGGMRDRGVAEDWGIPTVKEQARQWWDTVQRLGEKQTLVLGIEEGDLNAISQSRMLIEKYPDAAFDAIRTGIANSKESWVHRQLIQILCSLDDERAHDVLVDVLKNGSDLRGRIEIARRLSKRGSAQLATEAMMRAWQRLPKQDLMARDHIPSLARFFVEANSADAIQTITNDYAKLGVKVRFNLIDVIGSAGLPLFMPASQQIKLNENTKRAIETLLFRALDDPDRLYGVSGSRRGIRFSDPRLCAMAAYYLAERDDAYKFDFAAPLMRRDRMMISVKNVYRKRHGMDLLPVPKQRVNSGLPSEKTAPLLQAFDSDDQGAIEQATAGLRDLGLQALPAIHAKFGFPGEHDRKQKQAPKLRALANDISNTIVEVTVTPKDAIDADAFQNQCTTLWLTENRAAIFGMLSLPSRTAARIRSRKSILNALIGEPP